MEFDNSWCPACDRQIQPKRFTISVPVQQQPQPQHLKRRTKQPPVQLKKRTIIDQGPISLYCSDECQLADLSATHSGGPPIDPARDDPAAPVTFPGHGETPSSIAKLARLYNFPPLPPPPPTFETSDPPSAPPCEYTSGIMMAGRLISSLCPPPAKPHIGRHRPPPDQRKPVPGWTDGSNAWRASVYSFSQSQGPFHRQESDKAYSSLTASPHRAPRASSSSALPSIHPPPSQRSSSDQMIAKFTESFQHRSDPRASLQPSTPTPSSPTSTRSPPKRERSLLPPGVEGKLLVPNVKLKVHSSSTASLSSNWSGTTSTRSPLSVTSDSEEERHLEKSTVDSRSLPGYRKRPTVETRSWSYDNFTTYPIMQLPPKKIKQIQRQIVDGEEREVEVEVEVVEERKRLFIFAPSL